jgi:hypothetical protein
LNDKNVLAVLSTGVSISYTYRQFRVSYQELRHGFSIPVNRGDELYERLGFRGRALQGRSIAYHYTWRNMHGFGELASSAGGKAFLNGVMLAADKKLDMALVVRRITADYSTFGANAFTEYSGVSNEEGIYAGLAWRPLPTVAIDLYADHFRSSWVRYRLNAPSAGSDHHVQLCWRPTRSSSFQFRWKREVKMENLAGDQPLLQVQPIQRETLRVHLEKRFNEVLEWRSRLEWVWIKPWTGVKQNGFYVYADLFYKVPRSALSGNGRIMFYQASTYAARLYAFENDVMFYSLIPSFFGTGVVTYVNIRLQASEHLGLFLKWRSNISDGHISTQIRAQLVLTW